MFSKTYLILNYSFHFGPIQPILGIKENKTTLMARGQTFPLSTYLHPFLVTSFQIGLLQQTITW